MSQLRLAGAEPELEIVVRDRRSGLTLLQALVGSPGLHSVMQLANSGESAGRDLAGMNVGVGAVAGRIDAHKSELEPAIDDWIKYLAARKRSVATVRQYRSELARVVKACGWTSPSDVTEASLLGHLGEQARINRWKGGTYNRALCCCRSFTRYLARTKAIAEDPLLHAERATDDGGEGARAATLDEARRMIAYAVRRELADRRCRGARSLYWAMLFAMGMRADEPARLEWRRHVFLDEPIPHIVFTPDVNKNRRLQEVPIPPELVDQLREHRARMKAIAAAGTTQVVSCRSASGQPKVRLVDPDQDGAMLFPWSPPRVTFRTDRDAVAIEAKDRRGRGFSPHSARKFFETTLIDAGVQERVVDRLMRHSGGVQARYYDTEMKILSAAVEKMPKLWPCAGLQRESECGQAVDNFTLGSSGAKDGLQPGRSHGTFLAATSTTRTTDSSRPLAPGAPWSMSQFTVPTWAEGHAESSEPVPLGSPPAGSIHDSDPGMPILGQINADRTALADLLEAVARLLRESAHGRHAPPGRTA